MVDLVDDEMGEDYAKFAGLTAEEDLKEPLKGEYQEETSMAAGIIRSWNDRFICSRSI